MKKRYSGLNQSHKTKSNLSDSKLIFAARVQYIILDDVDKPDLFKKYGEWSSIGGILFHTLNSNSPFKEIDYSNYAKPLYSNYKNYPLENEIVYIISMPSNNVEADVNSTDYYYFQPINLWNSVHHNAIPDAIGNNLKPDSQTQDYQQTEAGSVRRVSDGSTEIPLGLTFKEKLDIKNILPYEGDVIYEGRWGQSIRFGSTVKNSNIVNGWSKSGENGDPIIIIRNGQYDDGKDAWIPILEDINQDPSSIYQTSNQTIPITLSSEEYSSYSTPPIKSNEYNEPQIILNSNRLLFNAKKDSILFSSAKSIGLNSNDTINLDAKNEIVAVSKKIKLGSKDADESLILGDKFFDEFKKFLTQLSDLCSKLPTVGTTVPYTPNIAVATAASKLQIMTKSLSEKLNSFKSQISKTK